MDAFIITTFPNFESFVLLLCCVINLFRHLGAGAGAGGVRAGAGAGAGAGSGSESGAGSGAGAVSSSRTLGLV